MGKKYKRYIIFFAGLLIIAGFSGARHHFGTSTTKQTFQEKDERLLIVSTTAHISDIVKNIAGTTVQNETIIQTGIDPHSYRPVRSDIVKLLRADMIIYNGGHLEGRLSELIHDISDNKQILEIIDYADTVLRNENGTPDPHIWMNVQNWISASRIISQKLQVMLPDKKDLLIQNTDRYIAELRQLDNDIKVRLQQIPSNKRVLITAHDAFGYYGEAYDIEVIGIQGLSTASEAGLKTIEALVDFVINKEISAIFTETSVNNNNVKAIQEGAKYRGHTIDAGSTLYSDSLGNADTPEGTYIGMMLHNTKTIAAALSLDKKDITSATTQ